MSGNSILNADMGTLARWVREGFDWWREELASLLPSRLQGRQEQRGPMAIFRPDRPIMVHRDREFTEAVASTKIRTIDFAVPATLSLQRTITVPAMRKSDLRGYLELQADRLLPLGTQALLIDAIAERQRDRNGSMTVRIAAIDRQLAQQALAAATQVALVPGRFGIVDDNSPARIAFDFAPQLRAEGLLPAPDFSRQLWWGLVALAVAINIGLPIWRDQQDVARLREIVALQEPAVSIYRKIAGRTARAEQTMRRTLARRSTHPALPDLAAATVAIPQQAWVQRYTWDGQSLRVAGYMRPPIDMISALRRDPRFINVHSSASDVTADLPIGQPFDITADIRRFSR